MKFPPSGILSLLDENLTYNLAESTAQNLQLGELLDHETVNELLGLRLGYGSSRGHAELRKVIAQNLSFDPEAILITSGAGAGLFLAIFLLCNAGDEVLTTIPNFPPIIDVIKAVGANLVALPLSFDRGYKLQLEEFRAALSPRTRLAILVTPHNPSGVEISTKEIYEAVALMREQCPEAYLIVDETYREAIYSGDIWKPTVAGLSPKVMTVASLSKCHGAPGLRIGWLTSNDPSLMEQLVLGKMNTFISCSVVDERLALEVLRRSQAILLERQALLRHALAKVEQWVKAESEYIEWVRPDAGALCCVRLRRDRFDESSVHSFNEQAKLQQVQLGCGSWFGEEVRIFRLGFGFLPLAQLDFALQAVSRALRASVT
jgi:aspartate/methionine/tyrosine aminotransferase